MHRQRPRGQPGRQDRQLRDWWGGGKQKNGRCAGSAGLEKLSELLRREARVPCDCPHRYRVDRRMPRNRKSDTSVAEDNVATLASYSVPEFLKNPYRIGLADSRNPGHDLDKDVLLLDAPQTRFLSFHFKPQPNRILYICHGLGAAGSLGMASRKVRAAHSPAFLGFK